MLPLKLNRQPKVTTTKPAFNLKETASQAKFKRSFAVCGIHNCLATCLQMAGCRIESVTKIDMSCTYKGVDLHRCKIFPLNWVMTVWDSRSSQWMRIMQLPRSCTVKRKHLRYAEICWKKHVEHVCRKECTSITIPCLWRISLNIENCSIIWSAESWLFLV